MCLSLNHLACTKALVILGAAGAIFGSPAASSAAIVTYTNLAAWQSALGSPVHTFDFESDIVNFPGYPTPFTNIDQWVISTIGSPITIQLIPNGIVNNSQELHFRDFGSQVRFTPPASVTPMYAFGFDYALGFEAWELQVPGASTIALPNNTVGFIGVISTTPLPDFIVTSPSNVQGGISIDNLRVPVPGPGSAALIGLGGLVAARRRRRVCR